MSSHTAMPLLLFGASLALYLMLRQRSFYAEDGFFIQNCLQGGVWQNTSHEAFLPILHLFAKAVAWARLDPHRVITTLSALGGALGVTWTYLGTRRLMTDPLRPAAAAAVVATTPAVVFFATAVEYHGSFFAFSQLAFWVGVGYRQRPSRRRGLELGLAMAGAALVHSSGWFLPLLLVPGLLIGVRRRPRASTVLLPIVVFALATFGAIWLARAAGIGVVPPFGLAFVADHIATIALRLLQVPVTFVHEWLLPLLPLSVLALLGLFLRPVRAAAAVAVLGGIAYAVPAALILAGDLREYGAYMLPCVGPLAVVGAKALRPGLLCVLAVVGGTIGVLQVRQQEQLVGAYEDVVRGAVAAGAGSKPLLLVAERVERGACVTFAGAVDYVSLGAWVVQDPAAIAAATGLIAGWFDAEATRGRVVLLSERAAAALERSPGGRALVQALRAVTRFEAIDVPGLRGWRLYR